MCILWSVFCGFSSLKSFHVSSWFKLSKTILELVSCWCQQIIMAHLLSDKEFSLLQCCIGKGVPGASGWSLSWPASSIMLWVLILLLEYLWQQCNSIVCCQPVSCARGWRDCRSILDGKLEEKMCMLSELACVGEDWLIWLTIVNGHQANLFHILPCNSGSKCLFRAQDCLIFCSYMCIIQCVLPSLFMVKVRYMLMKTERETRLHTITVSVAGLGFFSSSTGSLIPLSFFRHTTVAGDKPGPLPLLLLLLVQFQGKVAGSHCLLR